MSVTSLALAGILAACSAGAAPSPTTAPSLPPDAPVTSPPDGGGDPGVPTPSFVVPVAGQQDPRPVAITNLAPTVDGRHVVVRADWTSGIEPCYVLDRVEVTRDGDTFTITAFEGTGDPNAMCIEIAVYKSTLVDLGELEPGDYVVQTPGGYAAPVSFSVE